jgi:hypothetical protein
MLVLAANQSKDWDNEEHLLMLLMLEKLLKKN